MRSVTLHRAAIAAASLLVALLMAAPALAHEFKLDLVISTFVRIDAGDAHVLARVPIELLRPVRFPVKGAEIDLAQSGDAVRRGADLVAHNFILRENGNALSPQVVAARLSLPSNRSFETWDKARSHVATPIEPDLGIVIDQGYLDVDIAFPIASPDSTFALESRIASELGPALKVTVRYLPLHGDERAMVLTGNAGVVSLNPGWLQAAAGFVGLGITHIITGYDHLLFLLCLLLPLRSLRQIFAIATGFTLAHSVTLIGSALGLAPTGLWFPPFVEMVIALSIVYMALEDILGADFRRRVLLTMLFGLVHGFGFSYGLSQDLQFAGGHLLAALFAFNLGIELGQVLAIAVMLPVLLLVRRFVLPGRMGEIIIAALVAHVGWHWMEARYGDLALMPWPVPDAAGVAVLLAWAAALALLGAGVVAVLRWLRLDAPVPRAAGAD
jgi:hypothetical protein